jgi:signal transduction histidine kinase/ligand-binding sensor domain-containing protein
MRILYLKFLAHFLFFLLSGYCLNAQDFQYKLYTSKELPELKYPVSSIAQDKAGYIYLQNKEGLYRFDGSKLQTPDNYFAGFTSLSQTKAGEVLLLHPSGIYQIESFEGFRLKKIIDCQNPVRLYEDKKGKLWISLRNGEVLCRQNNKSIAYKPDNLPGFFFEDSQGEIVFVSEKCSVFGLKDRNQVVRLLEFPMPSGKITSLIKRHNGIILLTSSNGILEVKQATLNAFTIRRVLPQFLNITTLVVTSPQKIYAGTHGDGLLEIISQDTTYSANAKLFNKSSYNNSEYLQSLPFKKINCIFCDKEGRLWVSNEFGIALLYPRFFTVDHPALIPYVLEGMAQLQNGNYYFGSINRIIEYKPATGSVSSSLKLNEGSVASVTSEGNRVWVGNTNGMLHCIQDNKILHTLDFKQRGGSIFSAFGDSKRRIWFCQVFTKKQLPGITCTDSTFRVRYYGEEKGLKNRILVARQSASGEIYLGGKGESTYLYYFDEKQDKFINLSIPLPFESEVFEVHDLSIDKQNNIWLATSQGVFKYVRTNHTIQKIDLGEYSSSSEIRSIIVDKSDQIWIATDSFGLLLHKNGITLRFTIENGLSNNVLWYRLLYIDRADRLWVGSVTNYVVSTHSSTVPITTAAPVVKKVWCNGKSIDFTKKAIYLPYHATIEAEFTALSYPTQTIEYKIVSREIGKIGVSVSSKSSIRLPSLPSGKYEMEIKAKQSGYTWSSPLVIQFEVERVWYRSWWAYLLYALMAILIIRWIIVIYTSYLRKERERLNSLVSEKTKELHVKNHEISMQNAEITAQNEELLAQQEEITSQRDVLVTQNHYLNEAHEIIESQNKEIKSHNEYLEKEVKARTQELEEYNQQLEQFAFITAHNLRAPVARILGLGNVLELNKNNPQEQDMLTEKLIFATRELDQVIKDLNTILAVKKSYVNTNTLIDFRNEIAKLKKNLGNELAESQAVIIDNLDPDAVLYSFAPYIESILYNLVSNAIKYRHPDRRPVIEITTSQVYNMIYLTVKDNGLGIDLNAYRDKMFILYKRFHIHTEGKGMGLFLVKTEVNSLGGKIDVESTVNEGTVFHVLLPSVKPDKKVI